MCVCDKNEKDGMCVYEGRGITDQKTKKSGEQQRGKEMNRAAVTNFLNVGLPFVFVFSFLTLCCYPNIDLNIRLLCWILSVRRH